MADRLIGYMGVCEFRGLNRDPKQQDSSYTDTREEDLPFTETAGGFLHLKPALY